MSSTIKPGGNVVTERTTDIQEIEEKSVEVEVKDISRVAPHTHTLYSSSSMPLFHAAHNHIIIIIIIKYRREVVSQQSQYTATQ